MQAGSTTRLTREQVREVDRIAIERYHVPGIVLMENAARGVVEVALDMLHGVDGPVMILCGGGNNGGDGLAVARHLHNRGREVRILLYTDPAKYTGDALVNWKIVEAMRLSRQALHPLLLFDAALIIDAIFGTGLAEPPRPPFGEIARGIECSLRPVLAIDVPSGLDCDTGLPLDPSACVKAERTVTFVAEKVGFANPEASRYTGHVTVAGIGCPREVIDQVLQR